MRASYFVLFALLGQIIVGSACMMPMAHAETVMPEHVSDVAHDSYQNEEGHGEDSHEQKSVSCDDCLMQEAIEMPQVSVFAPANEVISPAGCAAGHVLVMRHEKPPERTHEPPLRYANTTVLRF